jgi:predicted ATP-grasp superfamily ATP-dependent carboligase
LSADRSSILIAAISGRALAASARRAGLIPLVADFFADADTAQIAHAVVKLPGPIRQGFQWNDLSAAVEQLATEAPAPLLGCLCGSGFEDRPALLDRIAANWPLLGNDAATVARTKSAREFFLLLDELHIPSPRTSITRPQSEEGWLMKREGGAGGSHIVKLGERSPADTRSVYFQKLAEGVAISALFIANRREARVLGFSEQWTTPIPSAPHRYGGAARPADLPEVLQEAMIGHVTRVSATLGLKGVCSADFLLDKSSGISQLLEINPRPGATLDIFDCGAEPLLKLHLDAVLEARLPPGPLALEGAMASAIVYAPERVEIANDIEWQDWVADRPKRGESIDKNRPICTVLARAATKAQTKELVAERMQQVLADLRPKNRGKTK